MSSFFDASQNCTQTICSHLYFILMCSVCAFIFINNHQSWHDCDSALQTAFPCSLKASWWTGQSGWISTSCVIDYWEEKSAGVLTQQWSTVKDCVRAFISKPGGFLWTLLKELCLKNRFGNEASSPQALKHFLTLARHPMPACCWHIHWRTLACLPITFCKKPSVSLFLRLSFSPSFLDLSVEGSSQT